MKTFAVLLLALGWAVTSSAPAATPVKPKTPAPAVKEADKDEPPPKIDGITIPRGEKGYMGLQIVDNTFKLTFYDTKKKKMAPDVSRAALRWIVHYTALGEERTVLVPGGDEFSLTSGKFVRPPWTFKLFITLITEQPGGEPTTETYNLDFRQAAAQP